MNYWKVYASLVNRHCASSGSKLRDLVYWRDDLFAATIIYVLPSCFITLLPSLYMTIVTRRYILAGADIATVTLIAAVAFMPGMSIRWRKIIFISCVYILSCALLYYLGIHGSGLVYLLAVCIFSLLIFTTKYPFWSVIINALLCMGFGIAKFMHKLPWPDDRDNSLGAWVAVSSSLIFLSFLSAALLTRVFNGLQETIVAEKKLRKN